jgi:hypothetical protein
VKTIGKKFSLTMKTFCYSSEADQADTTAGGIPVITRSIPSWLLNQQIE